MLNISEIHPSFMGNNHVLGMHRAIAFFEALISVGGVHIPLIDENHFH